MYVLIVPLFTILLVLKKHDISPKPHSRGIGPTQLFIQDTETGSYRRGSQVCPKETETLSLKFPDTGGGYRWVGGYPEDFTDFIRSGLLLRDEGGPKGLFTDGRYFYCYSESFVEHLYEVSGLGPPSLLFQWFSPSTPTHNW